MTPQPSRLRVDTPSPRTLVASGVIDSHTADELAGKLDALGATDDILLDLSGVEFIDSSGLRVVVNFHQELETAGKRLTLHGISEAVDRLLEITGLREHLFVT